MWSFLPFAVSVILLNLSIIYMWPKNEWKHQYVSIYCVRFMEHAR